MSHQIERFFTVPRNRKSPPVEPLKLVPAINESVKSIGTQSLTLLVTATYIAISAAGITDAAFIWSDKTSLPVINASIPVKSFFVLAPALLVLQHMTVLLQQYFVLHKLSLPEDWAQADTALFHPSIFIGRYSPEEHWPPVRWLLIIISGSTYLLLPLVVLVYLQACSVKYQDDWIRACIWICTLFDLIAAGGFILVSASIKENSLSLRRRGGLLQSGHLSGLRSKLVMVLLFSLGFLSFYRELSRFPDTCEESRKKIWGFLEVRRHVILDARALYARAASGGSQHQRAEGLVFRGLVLPCANFSDAPLARADFRGAVLRGAVFHRANLQEARFSDGSSERPANLADLAGVSFFDADLTRAHLQGTDLRGANFESANLQEANLAGADLSGVKALKVEMLATNLRHAILRGGDFREAQLAFADFRDAQLELARFWGAQLDGASFFRAATAGADFRNAFLRGARGLELVALNLRGARLWGLDSCSSDSSGWGSPSVMSLVDLRGVRFDRIEWGGLLASLRRRAQHPILDQTWASMRAEPGETCLTKFPLARTAPTEELLQRVSRDQLVLYDGPQAGTPLADWPERNPVTEDEFDRGLVQYLVNWACWEKSREIDRQMATQDWGALLTQRTEGDSQLKETLHQELMSASCNLDAEP